MDDPESQLSACLARVTDDGEEGPVTWEDADAAVAVATQLVGGSPTSLWSDLAQKGVSNTAVASALGAQMKHAEREVAWPAAALYSTLLRMPGAPVSSLFDTLTFTTFVHTLRRAVPGALEAVADRQAADKADKAAGAKPRGGGKAGARGSGKTSQASQSQGPPSKRGRGKASQAPAVSDDDDDDISGGDDGGGGSGGGRGRSRGRGRGGKGGGGGGGAVDGEGLVSRCCTDLPGFLAMFGMRDNPDVVVQLLEAGVEFASIGEPGSAAPAAAYGLVAALMNPSHGPVPTTAALALQRLAPSMMTTTGGGGGGGAKGPGAGRRAAASAFSVRMLRDHGEDAVGPALCALSRHLLLRAPDRAEPRAAAVASLVDVCREVGGATLHDAAAFLFRLSRSAKLHQRLAAIDGAHALLHGVPHPFGPDAGYADFLGCAHPADELLVAPWSAACVAVLLSRAHDKAAGVRSRALSHLVSAVGDFAGGSAAAVTGDDDVDRGDGEGGARGGGAPASRAFLVALCGAPSLQIAYYDVEPTATAGALTPGRGAALPATAGPAPHPAAGGPTRRCTMALPGSVDLDLDPVLVLARARACDEKGLVRKAGLLLLEAMLLLRAEAPAPGNTGTGAPSTDELFTVEAATSDSLMSVRRAALGCAARLCTSFPGVPAVGELWVRCALPLVRDNESVVADEAAKQVQELLLSRACAASGSGTAPKAQAARRALSPLLGALAAGGKSAAACVGKAIAGLAAKRTLEAGKVARGLESVISAASDARQRQVELGAWLLLEQLAAVEPGAPSWQFLKARWDTLRSGGGGTGAGDPSAATAGPSASACAEAASPFLWVISHAASRFPPTEAAALGGQLLDALLAFTLPPPAAAAHVAALHRLTPDAKASKKWAQAVLDGAHDALAHYMQQLPGAASQGTLAAAETKAAVALFTAGEVALLRAVPVSPTGGLSVRVQALTALRKPSQGGGGVDAMNGAGVDGVDGGAGVNGVDGDADEAIMTQLLGGGGRAVLSASAAGRQLVPGHAWVCLGKLCLVDEGLAKKCMPLFVQELGRCPSAVVRNNILVGLADMVTHFTAMGDCHVPRLAACVGDPHPLVRCQALALLAHLLLKDYVKWRGVLFHRFLPALVDESAQVRQLAAYLLGDALAIKAPALAHNHFVEALFVLNACGAGAAAGRGLPLSVVLGEGEGALGTAGQRPSHLQGSSEEMRAKRDTVYHTLLHRMAPDHKFSAQAKLVAEVLGGVADGALPLEECEEVLGDALRLLASREFHVSASRLAGPADEDAAVGGDAAGGDAPAAAARGRLVGALLRKHLVEGVVPLLVELRAMTQASKHPLLGAVMTALASLLRDHRGEIDDILAGDKQLARELMHDIQAINAAAKAAEAEARAHARNGGGAGAPPGAPAAPAAAADGAAAGGSGGSGSSGGSGGSDEDRAGGSGGSGAGGAAAAAMTTPGASLLRSGAKPPRALHADAGTAVRTPGAGVAGAARTPHSAPSTHRAAAATHPPKTPFTGASARSVGAPGSVAAYGATPAPLSVRRSRLGPASDAGAASEDGGAAPTIVALVSPQRAAAEPLRTWNVNLEGGGAGAAGGGGRGGAKAGVGAAAASRRAAAEAAAALGVAEGSDGDDAGEGGKGGGGAAAPAPKGGKRASGGGSAAAPAVGADAGGAKQGRGRPRKEGSKENAGAGAAAPAQAAPAAGGKKRRGAA